MTPDQQTDIIWRLKQQTFWPHAETIREDCGDGLKLIAHLNDKVAAALELVEQVTARDSATVNVDNAFEVQRWRNVTARLLAQLDQVLAEARDAQAA